jgi:hypothetical protein
MPQRETVAGEAAARSPTSKIIDMVPLIWMISELGRQSFLLSSSTAGGRCRRREGGGKGTSGN